MFLEAGFLKYTDKTKKIFRDEKRERRTESTQLFIFKPATVCCCLLPTGCMTERAHYNVKEV